MRLHVTKSMTVPQLAKKVGWWDLILTTGAFSGYFTLEPGTAGTIVAIPLYLLLVQAGWPVYIIGTVVLCALGLRGIRKIEAAVGSHDCGLIVIDEIVGYLVTMCFLPQHWLFMILGFGLFRFFDSRKPYPISRVDKNLRLGSWGVMLDDILAGIYGNLILQSLGRVGLAYLKG